MLPDLDPILVAYLRADATVAAVTDRIGTRTPPNLTEPWVRITLLDDRDDPRSSAQHLTSSLVQLDCFAGSAGDRLGASRLARAVRAALHALPGIHGAAVITGAKTSMSRQPDETFTPAMERYIVSADLSLHP